MKKLSFILLSLLFSISVFSQYTKPSNVSLTNMRPAFAKNVFVTDSLGIGKILLFDTMVVRFANRVTFKNYLYCKDKVNTDSAYYFQGNRFAWTDGGDVALGLYTLSSYISGGANTAIGYASLQRNTIGAANTALGSQALTYNIDGNYNTALGSGVLFAHINGNYNIGIGYHSLYTDTSGTNNIAIGSNSLSSNKNGTYNIAIGDYAGADYDVLDQRLYIDLSGQGDSTNSIIYGNGVLNELTFNSNTIRIKLPPKSASEDTVLTFHSGKINYYPSSGVHVHYADSAGYAYNSDKLDGQHGNYYQTASTTHEVLVDSATTAYNALKLGGQSAGYYQTASTTHEVTTDSTLVAYKALQLGSAGNCVDAYIDSIYGCSPVVISGSLKTTGNVQCDTLKYNILDPAISTDTSNYALNAGLLEGKHDTAFLSSTGDLGYNNYTFIDTVKINKAIHTPYIYGGATPTSDIHIKSSNKTGTSGGDLFLDGSNGTNGIQVLYDGGLDGLALKAQTGAPYITTFGYGAGVISTGERNTAVGFNALTSNISGTHNTAVGTGAAYYTTGNYNVAIGESALLSNKTGYDNVAIGVYAGWGTRNLGFGNIWIGKETGTGAFGDRNLAIGWGASDRHHTTDSLYDNVFIGQDAGDSANCSFVTAIGKNAGYHNDEDHRLFIADNDENMANNIIIYAESNIIGSPKVAIGDTVANARLDVRGSFMNENTVMGNTLTLTNNTADTIFKITFPSDSATYGNSVSGEISYTVTVRASNGTQIEKGIIQFVGTEYLGVVTPDIGTDVSRVAKSSGTLTVTSSLTYNSTLKVWYITITSNSNLTTPVTKVEWNVINNNNTTLTNY